MNRQADLGAARRVEAGCATAAFRRRYHLLVVGAAWAAAAITPAAAADLPPREAATEQVRVQLVASVDAAYPGAEILVGLNQRIIPHWHTYWKNPGDSGLATSIDWRLPAGATAGEILWPTPSVTQLGNVTNFAYADDVTLLSVITVPADAKPGEHFPIVAKAKWLVCEEICIPQQADLGLDLPVVADRSSVGPGSPLIAAAQRQLPVASPWAVKVSYAKDGIRLWLGEQRLNGSNIKRLHFFPDQWGRIAHGAAQTRVADATGVTLQLQPGEAPPGVNDALTGVLAVTESTGEGEATRGYAVTAQPGATTPGSATPSGQALPHPSLGLPTALLFALLGGAILNLMPCVFPVLSLKALQLIKQTSQSPEETRRHGWLYTVGVLASFALLGAVLLALKAGGAAIGWGFQFQSPLFVLWVAFLLFAVGLSLSGVLTVGTSIVGIGSSLANRQGYVGSFLTGTLASIVAAPCTAPFMGAALGYAIAQPALELFAVLAALGFGLAAPFLLLTHWPGLQRHLPRPGAWMETLKQILAFPMYATAVWLVWVLAQQAGADIIPVALGGMVAIGFAAWLRQRAFGLGDLGRRWVSGIAASVIAATLLLGFFSVPANGDRPAVALSTASGKNWEAYSPERLQALRGKGEPVFLNFTAAWCVSCLVNERVALSSDVVGKAFSAAGVTYLKGDWTHRDARITAKLEEFGRDGVPLYVFYPAGSDSAPTVLPQILTPDIVLAALARPTASLNPVVTLKE